MEEAQRLSAEDRVELGERLVESLGRATPSPIAEAQWAEVRRRSAGNVVLIPGEETLAHVRQIVSSALANAAK